MSLVLNVVEPVRESVMKMQEIQKKLVERSEPKLRALSVVLSEAERKIEIDIFRFRTCCADPRASK